MKYAILVYETEQDFSDRKSGPNKDAYWGGYMAYSEALKQAGAMAGGQALQEPSTATTLRLRDTGRHVQDGPFAATKEMLGGMFVIEAPDLDAALELAAKCPSAKTGSVEVRPLLEME